MLSIHLICHFFRLFFSILLQNGSQINLNIHLNTQWCEIGQIEVEWTLEYSPENINANIRNASSAII